MEGVYSKGELLQIHTKENKVVKGLFYNMTRDKSRISLCNIKGMGTGVCHYYAPEITDIIRIDDEEYLTKNFNKIMKISQKDCDELINISKKYIYINQINNTFHEALKDLQQFSYIGVSTDGAPMGRKCSMPFITLSTPKQIYIFDTQVMQVHAFNAGLKEILESDYPKKIIHDCRKISDCLSHKHNVELNSVFDTQVGDLIIIRNKRGSLPTKVKSLAECLHAYFGLPQSIIEEKFDIVQCSERPLSVTIKEALAKNIVFLHRLSEAINEEMKLPFVRGVQCYLENMRSCDFYKAWELCGKEKHLPSEFTNAIQY